MSVIEAAPPQVQRVPGVTPLSDRDEKIQRRAVLFLTVAPFAGAIFAIATLWGSGLSLTDGVIALSFYFFTGLGVTVGYHRLFTHQSFEPRPALKAVLAIAGSMSLQGSLISWVAIHRRHHAFSDKEGDPHSPHLDEGPGVAGVVRGLWHAHVGWLVAPENTDAERWAPDLLRDPMMRNIDAKFPHLAILSFVLPALIGGIVTQSFYGALTAFLWGSLARIFLLHHVTWSINSICHFYGRRPFRSSDFSTNNWVLAILSFGESWHNNHHAFPTSAIHGIGKGQVDLSGGLIRLFEKVGLARKVKLPSPKQLAAKAVEDFKPRAALAQASRVSN